MVAEQKAIGCVTCVPHFVQSSPVGWKQILPCGMYCTEAGSWNVAPPSLEYVSVTQRSASKQS